MSAAKVNALKKPLRQQGQLRIIGGTWRSRRITFAQLEGVRPTPDRIRETLFNWLREIIPEARCLDLFAGSGALALESLSRGAATAVMVDCDRQVIDQLRENLLLLQTNAAKLVEAEALEYLRQTPNTAFDVVFLDPPFASNLLPACITALEHNGWLSTNAFIYIEAATQLGPADLPPNWALIRHKKAGQVAYHLIKRSLPPNKSGDSSFAPEEKV